MNECIKILHVVLSLEPGGMENGLANLATHLDASRFETHFFCIEKEGAFAARLPRRDLVYLGGKTTGFSASAVWRLNAAIRRVGANLVHSHNLGALIYSSLATIGGRLCPIIHGEHSELAGDDLSQRRNLQRRIFFPHCARIHSVGRQSKAQIEELGFAKRVEAIQNGVDTCRFTPSDKATSRRLAGINEGAFVLGVAGRFGPSKRHDVLIEAFSRLAGNQADLHLLIIGGGGSQETAIRDLIAASPFSDRIHLMGFREKPELFYPGMDLLVVPSVNEGLSNVLLEAMACDVPALSHTSCGASEIIEDGVDGWIRNCGTASSLASSIGEIRASADHLKSARGKVRDKVVRSFSLARMASSYARMYEEVAAGIGEPPVGTGAMPGGVD